MGSPPWWWRPPELRARLSKPYDTAYYLSIDIYTSVTPSRLARRRAVSLEAFSEGQYRYARPNGDDQLSFRRQIPMRVPGLRLRARLRAVLRGQTGFSNPAPWRRSVLARRRRPELSSHSKAGRVAGSNFNPDRCRTWRDEDRRLRHRVRARTGFPGARLAGDHALASLRRREYEVPVLDVAAEYFALADAAEPVLAFHVDGNAMFDERNGRALLGPARESSGSRRPVGL